MFSVNPVQPFNTMTTNSTDSKLTAAAEFILWAFNDPEMDHIYRLIPEVFVQQMRDGLERFEINKNLISDSNYSGRGSSKTDFIRIVVEDPLILDENTIQFKLRLSGVMDYENGELKCAQKGRKEFESESHDWLSGFRSLTLYLTREDVDLGIITQFDWDNLVRYAKHWMDVSAKEGPEAMYKKSNDPNVKGHSRERLYLTALNPDFQFQFDMEVRVNPNEEGGETVGIYDVDWINGTFIGFGTGAPPKRVGAARKLAQGAGIELGQRVKPKVAEVQDVQSIPSRRGPARN